MEEDPTSVEYLSNYWSDLSEVTKQKYLNEDTL